MGDRSIDWGIEIMTVVIVIAVTLPFIAYTIKYITNEEYGGFHYKIVEKTALSTAAELYPIPNKVDYRDMLLMLLIADDITHPGPDRIDFGNGKYVDVNKNFMDNKIKEVMNVYAELQKHGGRQLEVDLAIGKNGWRHWYIRRK